MAFCTNCGTDRGDSNSCPKCGTNFGPGGVGQAPPAQPTYFQPPQPVYVVQAKTNGFAIASFVCSLVCGAPLAVIFGHIALSQINKNHEGGRGLAIAGLVIGYIGLAFLLLFIIGAANSSSGY